MQEGGLDKAVINALVDAAPNVESYKLDELYKTGQDLQSSFLDLGARLIESGTMYEMGLRNLTYIDADQTQDFLENITEKTSYTAPLDEFRL